MNNTTTVGGMSAATRYRRFAPLCLLAVMLSTVQPAHADSDIVSNLLTNGTFDSDIGGWDLKPLSNTSASWSAEGDTSPGSFRGTQDEGGNPFTKHDLGSQCIAVDAGELYQLQVSAKLRQDNQADGQVAIYTVWPAAGCAAPEDASYWAAAYGSEILYPSTYYNGWQTRLNQFQIPQGVSEVRIALSVTSYESTLGDDGFGAYFDDISFGRVKADLVADINFGGQTTYAGSEVTFDVSISNKSANTGTAQGATARVLSDKRLRVVSETCPGDMVNTTQGDSGWINWFNLPPIESGDTIDCTITAEVEPGSSGTIFPRMEVDCPDCDLTPSDNQKTDTLIIGPRADIAVHLSADPFQSIERPLRIYVELENLGTKLWQQTVAVTRPAGAVLQSTHCGADNEITVEDDVFLSFPMTVDPYQSRTCTLYFEYSTPGELLTFSLSSNAPPDIDYDPTNNSDSASLTTVSLRVTSPTIDRGDANPGDGVCATQVGRAVFCTLRGAIDEANALPGFQIVTLPYSAGGYPLSSTGGENHITITDTVRVIGEKQGDDTPRIFANWVDAAERSRIFVIDSPTGSVHLFNLDLIGQDHLIAGNGGLVRINNTQVLLNNVLLEDGGANSRGGALYSNHGLILINAYVGNSTAPRGGGIAFEPTDPDALLRLDWVRIYDNSQTPFAPQGYGGGIWANGGIVSIKRSAIDNNYSNRGGGLALQGNAMAEIENSTFSSNEAIVAGGGVWAGPANVDINFATFAHNSANPSSDTQGEGGGVYISAASTVRVSNSIFSNNQAQVDGIFPKGSTCFGSMISRGFNTYIPSAAYDGDCSVNINNGDNNTAAAILAALAPTGIREVPYHDLIGEGLDIDRASPDCLSLDGTQLNNDQRGLDRPVDGNQDGTARCDKGAVESDGDLPGLIVDCPAQVSVEAGSTSAVSCSITSINGAAGNVYFSCLGAPPSCDFTPEPLVLAADATADVELVVFGNGTEPVSTITVDAILSPARGQAEIEVTTTGDLGGDTIMINASITGSGKIVSSPEGLKCSVSCAESFPLTNSPIELTATPAAGWEFSAWSGDCAGAGTALPDGSSRCTITSSEDRTVGAIFVLDTSITVGVVISGAGTVTSTPAGIDCPDTCAAGFADQGGNIILTAIPDPGWSFTGWSGTCSGTQSCSLPRSSDHLVTAQFEIGVFQFDSIFQDSFE